MDSTNKKERYMGAKETAHFLGIKMSTLYSWKSKGLLPCYKPSGTKGVLLFKKEELVDTIEKGKVVNNGDSIQESK